MRSRRLTLLVLLALLAQPLTAAGASIYTQVLRSAPGSTSPGAAARPAGPPLALRAIGSGTQSTLALPILLLAGLLALAVVGGSLAALARWRGWGPAWAAGWTHAWSEVGYRSEGWWLEFTDWLRSGH